MQIKLYKAIKLKAKLIGELKNIGFSITQENTIVVGNTRNYDVKELIAKYDDKMNCLVKVKNAIHLANNNIYSKICLLSEYKLKAANFKRMDCKNGPNTDFKSYREEIITEFDSEIIIPDRDALVKELESKITILQDELDEYNYTTTVEIKEVC